MREGPPSTDPVPATAVLRASARLRYLARHARIERRVTALVMALVVGVAVVVWLRTPIADWLWPDTRIQQLRGEAEAALQAGRLSAPNGRGARELFEAAIALDPDRPEARAGLARVGRAALVEAARATQSGRFAHAHRHLALAVALSLPRTQTDAVARRLRQRETDLGDVARTLAQADAALASGQLESALDHYVRVQRLMPAQTRALEGREDVLTALLARAHGQIASGQLDRASASIARARAADPGHIDLAETMATLSQAVDALQRDADRDLRQGRLARALQRQELLLRVDPGDARARAGRDAVAQSHLVRSARAASDFRFDLANRELASAVAITPDHEGVARVRAHLLRAQRMQAKVAIAPVSAQSRRRVDALLARATQARRRGDLLVPPGDSVFDAVRAARAIAPDDPRVRVAMHRLQPDARACFEGHLRGNRLLAARGCLDARSTLEGDTPSVRDARRRLARRWIAVGDERLGAGELDRARHALASARDLDGQVPGLAAFAERVRSAGALERR